MRHEKREHENLDRPLETALERLLERYAPATRTRRLRWSRGETQVLELGSGSPVLLLHGGMGSVVDWVPLLSSLAGRHRVFAVDRPGHGLADPFDYAGVDLLEHACTFLRDVVDALGLATVDLVASSLGGLWAAAFALEHADRVSHLVLPGAPVGYKRGGPLFLRLLGLPVIGQRLGRRSMSNPTRESNRTFWSDFLVARPECLADALLDADVAHMRRNVESMLGLLGRVLDARGIRRQLILGRRWADVRVPTLFLWGERDAFGTPQEGEALAAMNPSFRLIRIDDAGHLPWLDDAERVTVEIERFLA